MQRVLTVPTPASWRGRALVVESIEGALEEWFSGAEIAEAGAFARARRREEWLLSRYAAKRLAMDRGVAADPRNVAVVRPRLSDGSWLSLSHSRGVAAAAIDNAPIGVDVERMRNVDERASRHFMVDDEIVEMRRCTIPNRILHWFCAKEAAWKQQGGATRFLKEVPLRLVDESATALRFETVETCATTDYVMALTIGPLVRWDAATISTS
jgi:phosphopantetheinyl transferase